MGQKIHPLGFRLIINQSYKSLWFSNMRTYSQFIKEDFIMRSYLKKLFYKSNIADIQIIRRLNQIEINLHIARPGIILGIIKTNITNIKNNLVKKLKTINKIKINIIEISNLDQRAILLSEWISQQLEKRIAFKRVIKQSLQKISKSSIKGIKIQISGRLNGATIARKEWIREGRVPLQTLRANIDYGYTRAYTRYGILGTKVWLFKSKKLLEKI
uniref:Small ribosomal subunit protein uS3c n=1 Tax=Choreocolax polysiphoniae TaxID=282351 RepID=A0A0B5W2I8_9FLOR|nr:30S ribosomal protein S3 [Choreocolax polysiphoniae]AJH65864.1 30S ribosomal protein S3 [Choreocolax polysiphoniae]